MEYVTILTILLENEIMAICSSGKIEMGFMVDSNIILCNIISYHIILYYIISYHII